MSTTETNQTAATMISSDIARAIYRDDARLSEEFAKLFPGQKQIFCDLHEEMCKNPSAFDNKERAEAYLLARNVAHTLVEVKKAELQNMPQPPAPAADPEPAPKRTRANDAPMNPAKAQAELIKMQRKAAMKPEQRMREAPAHYEQAIDEELAEMDDAADGEGVPLPANLESAALNMLSGGTLPVKVKNYPSEDAFNDELYQEIQKAVHADTRTQVLKTAANGGRVTFDRLMEIVQMGKQNRMN